MIVEFAVLVLLAASGVSASWLLGVRNVWLHLPVGLAVVTVLRAGLFSLLNLFDLRAWLNPSYYLVLFVVLLVAAWTAQRQLYQSFWLAVALSIVSVISTRVLGLSTAPRADSLWILSLTKLFNTSGDLNKLDRISAIRRGFAYPLMLSLGPQTEWLSAFTPYAYLVLAVTLIWAITSLSRASIAHRVVPVTAALMLVVVTAIMPIRLMFYIGPHSLVAIGYTLAAVAVALAVRAGRLSQENRVVLLLGFALAAISTAEALAILSIIAIPLFSQRWVARLDVALLTLAGSLPFAIWMATYNSYLIQVTGLVWWIICPAFVALGLLIATKPFDLTRYSLKFLVPIGLLIFLAVMHLAYPRNMSLGNSSLIDNLFFGNGEWGALPYVVIFSLLVLALFGLRRQSAELGSLFYTVTVGILASLVAKILAGGQLGDPLLGRFAWTDSLNRMWFHILAIGVVTIVIGVAQQDWLWRAQISGKLERVKADLKRDHA